MLSEKSTGDLKDILTRAMIEYVSEVVGVNADEVRSYTGVCVSGSINTWVPEEGVKRVVEYITQSDDPILRDSLLAPYNPIRVGIFKN